MSGPPPRHGPRDPGDAWVEGPDGGRFWGRFGAAGLLAHDPERGILLQHRVEWSHFGGTWGIPGGARRLGEEAGSAAVRESEEEAGVPVSALQTVFSSVLDLGFWSYTTVAARVRSAFEPVVSDAESLELRWVPVGEVDALPLHPAFAEAWPRLRGQLGRRVRLVVDAANLVGSRPDGWWRDRRGAAERLLAGLAQLARRGVPASELHLPLARWWPEVVVVVEGQARGAALPATAPRTLTVRPAPRDGDQEVVDTVAALLHGDPSHTGPDSGHVQRSDGPEGTDAPGHAPAAADGVPEAGEGGPLTVVVTADRELRARVEALGAEVRGPGWLWPLMPPR